VHCTGYSRGARFCMRLASELSSQVASVAPVSGLRFPEPNNATRPVPILAFHGKKDPINPFQGNGNPTYWHSSVPQALARWASFNSCSGQRWKRLSIHVAMSIRYDCLDGANVQLVQMDDGGHTWPGTPHHFSEKVFGKTNREIDANSMMWHFFDSHPRGSVCHTSLPGELCYSTVQRAMQAGLAVHPEWKSRLTNSSSFEEFQAVLHDDIYGDCPQPCPPSTGNQVGNLTTTVTATSVYATPSTSTTLPPTSATPSSTSAISAIPSTTKAAPSILSTTFTAPYTTTSAFTYDCMNTGGGWPAAMKAWCCRHHNLGCEGEPSKLSSWCHSGLANWKTQWSALKKSWCCSHYDLGCERLSMTTAPFDCEADLAAWRMRWSVLKQVWCCENRGKGCGMAATTLLTSTTTTTTEPFDCQAGLSNARNGWSILKQAYCCEHHQLGCQLLTSTTTWALPATSAPFDCQAGVMNAASGWSGRKKRWCCAHMQLGCEQPDPYECGILSWGTVWSDQQKAWCCENRGWGCEQSTTQLVFAAPKHDCGYGYYKMWSEDKQKYCCQAVGVGCAFNCNAGFATWESAWTAEKKTWCCEHKLMGCTAPSTPTTAVHATSSYDCSTDLASCASAWSAEQVAWCWHHQGVKCELVEIPPVYNCKEHFPGQSAMWSEDKRDWCCRQDSSLCMAHGMLGKSEVHRRFTQATRHSVWLLAVLPAVLLALGLALLRPRWGLEGTVRNLAVVAQGLGPVPGRYAAVGPPSAQGQLSWARSC